MLTQFSVALIEKPNCKRRLPLFIRNRRTFGCEQINNGKSEEEGVCYSNIVIAKTVSKNYKQYSSMTISKLSWEADYSIVRFSSKEKDRESD